ncbi:GNAT family N-acetyltransferase [Peribacillus simplex]|uniref:GNAT family N-acetyltransferase n=1 Tax=Peribacillus simplex TaxID=1478 RepID=UPI003D2AA978
MEIKTYTHEFEVEWDEFVQHSRNGTFMQQRQFINYHPLEKFQDFSLMVYDGQNRLIAVIPAALKIEGDVPIFCSYPGASHGGIIIQHRFDTSKALALTPLLIEHCRRLGFKVIEIKMVPRIYQSWPSDEIDFSLRYHGFSPGITELCTVLPLKEIDSADSFMDKNAVRNKNKAINQGVTVKESEDIISFCGILEQNLKKRHNTLPTHTYTEILDLIKKFPGKIKLISAYYQGEMIAGVLVFILNSRVINCFYICHNDKFQHLRPLNLIFSHLITWGKDNGFHFVDWGISTENKGKLVNSGLFKFKEGFGGRGILRETYSLNL